MSDSHAHADLGGVLAVVPVNEFAAYFEHFFTRYYSHLGFNMEEGKDKRGHFSLLSCHSHCVLYGIFCISRAYIAHKQWTPQTLHMNSGQTYHVFLPVSVT